MVKSIKEKTVFGQTLPQNIVAERSILGAVLLNNNALDKIEDTLRPYEFYDRSNGIIYSAMLKLRECKKQIDAVTISEELKAQNQLENCGGELYLVSLCEDLSAIGKITEYTGIIKGKALFRRVIEKTSEMASRAFTEDSENVTQFCDDIQRMILATTTKSDSEHFAQLGIWLKRGLVELSKPRTSGVFTGFHSLDDVTNGFKPGELIIIGARPRVGKTAIALNMALSAIKECKNVLFISLEMTGESLGMRILSAETGIPKRKIERFELDQKELIEITNTTAWLGDTSVDSSDRKGILNIEDEGMRTIFDIRSRARSLKMEGKLDIVFIDYLGRITPVGHHENRNIEISVISNALKALSMELRVPVVTLAQLSRSPEKRVDKRPMLSDLRDSGSLEQDADVILFLHRESLYNPDFENPGLTELIIAKNRHGESGTINLDFDGSIQKFTECE